MKRPPIIKTSDPESFAYYTLNVRVPKMVEDTIAANDFPAATREALLDLRREVMEGTIRHLAEDAPDRDLWLEASQEFVGRGWLDVPWFWAETFFHRRILEATGYFQAGSGSGVDPFAPIKATEWRPEVAPTLLNTILTNLSATAEDRFAQLMYASLWGNRVDLSYNVAGHLSQSDQVVRDTENVLVDDVAEIWTLLQRNRPCQVAFIADNAGTEFAMDLALIDFLLQEDIAVSVTLYLKPQPFFISDAMPQDLVIGLDALSKGGPQSDAMQQRIRSYQHEGRFQVHTHWFFPSSLFYFQMPEDLASALTEADFVFLKGDANYRRLLGDAHWPMDTPFVEATTYFPTALAALRTLKSEIIVGLTAGIPEKLSQTDADWLVNGRRGVIQSKA